ncbi:hypothetical protein AU467_25890 [Mesorhizobium loti]|uniref:Uncharacterized protein n=1 Tax=Rhizobium loti TaxID=381 RepID=A0A101KRE9_RHILI|nr:hypothetical protein AU467_25890 [Mesorhizobium loti]
MTSCLSFMSANGIGWMIWGAGLFWLLVLVLLGLAVAALIKFLRSDPNSGATTTSTRRHWESS